MKQLPLIPVVQLDLTLGMQVERHQRQIIRQMNPLNHSHCFQKI